MAGEMTREELAAALDGLETRLNSRTDRLEQNMNARFVRMDEQFQRVDAAQFDEVHARVAQLQDNRIGSSTGSRFSSRKFAAI